MFKRDAQFVWNDEMALCTPVVDGWWVLPGGVHVKREAFSVIEKGAIICDRVIIGAGVIIRKDAFVDYGAMLANEAVVNSNTLIGAGCSIEKRAVIGAGVKLSPGVFIGAHTQVEDAVQIDRGTRIGDSCVIGKGSRIGCQVVIRNRALIGKSCTIADGVHLASRAKIAADSYILMSPISVQGPRHLVALVSPTEAQIGSVLMSFNDWFDIGQRDAAFKSLGIDGPFATLYIDILEFMEDHAKGFSHLSFGK